MNPGELSDAVAHQLFRSAADLSSTAVSVTRAAGDGGTSEIVYANEAFSEMTGYAPDEVIGRTPGLLQGPKTDRQVLEWPEERVGNGETFHGETVNCRKDGSEFTLEWKVMPVSINGEVTHSRAVQRDVTNG